MPKCKFQNGFSRKISNSTWNKKDREGSICLVLLVIVVILLVVILFVSISNRKMMTGKYWIVLYVCTGIFIAALVVYCARDPIRIIYAGSALISNNIRTPSFLNRGEYFPQSKEFESHWKEIRSELDTLLSRTNNGKEIRFTRDSFSGENNEIGADGDDEKGWRIYHVRLGSSFTKHGRRDFPTLCKILRKCPNVVACSVSILEGKTHIPMHVGYFKGVMRYMLALKIPKNKDSCFLCVNGDRYTWNEGGGVLWDDTYPHRVENNTNENRVVLYMDVKRPMGPFMSIVRDTVLNIMEGTKMVKDEVQKTEFRQKILD
jgi:beta-hydroxylase